MKVLIIQPWISWRGAETVSVLEAYYLNKLGHQAEIACLYVNRDQLPYHGDEIDYILPPKWLSTLFARHRIFFFFFSFPVLLWLVLRAADNFEILNPHNLPSSWVAALVKKIKPKLLFWTAHGVPPEAGFARTRLDLLFWQLGIRFLDQWALKQADRIIAVSGRIKRDVKRKYQAKVIVLPPPIEHKLYSSGDREKLRKHFGFGRNVFLLLHVSRLHSFKEPSLSLQILARVKGEIKDAHLFFVGGEKDENLMSEARSLGIENKVHFAGFVEPTRLKDFYTTADLALVPYWRREGCPATPFQALAAGTLSIVAKGSGADEIIGKEKVGLVAKSNVKNFSKAVLKFYHNRKKWEKIARKGKTYVKKNLSGEVYARKLEKIFRSVEQ